MVAIAVDRIHIILEDLDKHVPVAINLNKWGFLKTHVSSELDLRSKQNLQQRETYLQEEERFFSRGEQSTQISTAQHSSGRVVVVVVVEDRRKESGCWRGEFLK